MATALVLVLGLTLAACGDDGTKPSGGNTDPSQVDAVAPPEVAKVIRQAHNAAVLDALRFLEGHAIFTREGSNGVRQVETRGLIAAAFLHRDSRAGDPDLHTHIAAANKV